jgi:hypothetical protein
MNPTDTCTGDSDGYRYIWDWWDGRRDVGTIFYERVQGGSITWREVVAHGWVAERPARLETTPDQYESHRELLDRLVSKGFSLTVNTQGMTCPACEGEGGWWAEDGFVETGSGFGDARPIERPVTCGDCNGEGVCHG